MPKVRPFSAEVKAAAACVALFAAPALADETHGEMVVTANRVETESEKIGSSVTVITAEQIERSQKTSVADLLRDVPGVSVTQTGGAGRTTAVRLRGLPGHYTKVIIDGVNMADPSRSQPSYEFGNLLTADIERIEVVRGPQSLLYGGDAAGGVINITTRKGQGKPRLSAMAEIGSLHTYTAATNLSGSQDRVSYALGLTHFETDGISAASKRNGNTEHDPSRNDTFNARLGLKLTEDWDVEASGRYTNAFTATDGWDGTGKVAIESDNNTTTTERSGRLATNFALFNGRFLNTIAYSMLETERDLRTGKRSTSFFDGETGTTEYQGTVKIAPDHTLLFGTEHRNESTQQGTNNIDVANQAYFTDYQFSPLDSLYLTAGGRLDDHQAFGTHKTYRGTAAYLVDATNTRLHSSYATGFRAPSLYELYAPTWGNTGLQPEKSRGWDFGVEQSLAGGRASVDVTAFENRFQNMIIWNTAGYRNVASASTQGIETAAHWTVNEQVRLNASYTFTDSRDHATGTVLARQPKHQASLGTTWKPMDGLTTDATLRLVGHRYDGDSASGRGMGGYGTLDIAVSYDLTDWAKVFGRVENLFDKDYEEAATYGTPGRMVFAGVKGTF